MKILFLNLTEHLNPKIKHPRHIHPPLDIGYCASLLDAHGHETFFMDFAIKKFPLDKIISFVKKRKIKVVVFKLSPCILSWGLNFLNDIKKNSNVFLVGIGPTPTVLTSELLFKGSPVDLCIVEEPEITLLELINRIESGKKIENVLGTAFLKKRLIVNKGRPFINDLDCLPFPKHSFFLDKGYTFFYPTGMFDELKTGFILSTRGCPYNCIFCSPVERVSFGKTYRVREPGKVVDEMESIKKTGVNFIYFEDDNFTFNNDHVKKICEEITKRRLKMKWGVQARVDNVDYETLKLMKKAGCSTICFGIESGSSRILKIINKGINLKQIKNAVQNANKLGIKTIGFFIIGNPSEKRKEIIESLSLAKKLPLDMVQVHFFTTYPGSKAFRNFVNNSNIEDLNTQDFPTSFSCLSKEELKRYQKYFYLNFYFTTGRIFKTFSRFLNLFNLKNEIKLLKQTISYLVSG